MTDEKQRLIQAARQIIETDRLFGGDSLPSQHSAAEAAGKTQPTPASLSPQSKARMLEDLDQEHVQGCRLCGLCENRSRIVFGEGNPDADLVFVGEGPGQEEDLQGRPFVGRAGQLLTKMIQAMGLTRQNLYICNLVKCRPPGNRAPSPEEVQACWSYLIRQLQIIAPKVIVTLGNPATQNLLNTREGITRIRGNFQKLPLLDEGLADIDVMPTFHPAYLLRQYSQDNRAKVWDDLQKVMKALGLDPPKKS